MKGGHSYQKHQCIHGSDVSLDLPFGKKRVVAHCIFEATLSQFFAGFSPRNSLGGSDVKDALTSRITAFTPNILSIVAKGFEGYGCRVMG